MPQVANNEEYKHIENKIGSSIRNSYDEVSDSLVYFFLFQHHEQRYDMLDLLSLQTKNLIFFFVLLVSPLKMFLPVIDSIILSFTVTLAYKNATVLLNATVSTILSHYLKKHSKNCALRISTLPFSICCCFLFSILSTSAHLLFID